MNNSTLFITIFIATILITRTFLYIYPTPSPTIQGFRIHHYMYGLALMPVAIIANSVPLFAIGTALFIDELTYLITGGTTHYDNYSKISLAGTLVLTIAIYLLREKITSIFN